jgi:carbonic anhydrase/acetyltransferase-like protein (isoleucine patch superfamily)
VKAGLKIGVGSIIGAGSVVTKDIPPYSIAVGNPCRIIKFRFSEEVIKGLISTNWWDYEDAKLHQLTKYFISPEKFLAILETNDFSI